MEQTGNPDGAARILALGRDPQFLAHLSTILENEGHDVSSFGLVDDLIRDLHRHPIIDLIAADLDGLGDEHYEGLKTLNCNDRFKRFPMIAFGRLGDHQAIQRASALGIVSYVLKPIKAGYLVTKVNEILKSDPGSVLVVDDEPPILDILRRTIEWAGYKVITASSGPRALKIMDRAKVALVISDIEMPEMTGLSLIPEINRRFRNIPVIIVTGHGDRYNEDKVKEAGAVGMVTKPFNNRLVRLVHTACATASQRRTHHPVV